MRKLSLVVLALLIAVPVVAQRGKPPVNRLSAVQTLRCTFPTHAATLWNSTGAHTGVGEESFGFDIGSINLRRGASLIVGARGSAEATAMLTETGLNVIEQTPGGNFILTSVFAAGGPADKFIAVHSRHLGDLTTPPTASQYFGTCEVVN